MKFSFALLGILFVFNLLAQDTIRLKEVEVNANRVSNSYKNQLRMVQIVGSEELKKMPVSSIADVLDYMGTVDVRQRGVNNVQADLSIRGGNYEQTLVMVNGVPVNDPQTGHHSLNIPIDYTCIERIELLSGGDARRYGANAFSGTINIVTKDSEQNNIHISVAGGDFKYFEG
ncbi:MAG: TonB-dependent receptor plug domain-containing protein [Bacteroidales bacterium]|nr:TonB-dependent receptor plug domain-containing protein [Bacteroidales bacterium]